MTDDVSHPRVGVGYIFRRTIHRFRNKHMFHQSKLAQGRRRQIRWAKRGRPPHVVAIRKECLKASCRKRIQT